MRVFIFWIAVLGLQPNSLNGQTRIYIDGPSRNDETRKPLVMVDTFKTDLNHLVLDPDKIVSITIFKDSAAISKFGDAAKFGVIIIHPKTDANFLRVGKIFEKYKLSDDDKKLRICIDNTLIRNPGLILIESSEIECVTVTKDRHWINIEDANSGEKFINITTKSNSRL